MRAGSLFRLRRRSPHRGRWTLARTRTTLRAGTLWHGFHPRSPLWGLPGTATLHALPLRVAAVMPPGHSLRKPSRTLESRPGRRTHRRLRRISTHLRRRRSLRLRCWSGRGTAGGRRRLVLHPGALPPRSRSLRWRPHLVLLLALPSLPGRALPLPSRAESLALHGLKLLSTPTHPLGCRPAPLRLHHRGMTRTGPEPASGERLVLSGLRSTPGRRRSRLPRPTLMVILIPLGWPLMPGRWLALLCGGVLGSWSR